MTHTLKKLVLAVVNSYSEIFFLKRAWIGLIMMAVTFLNPNIGGAGLIGMVSAYALALFLRMDQSFLNGGFYTYNPLLVGLSMGYLFKLTPLTITLVVIASILTYVLTHMMYNIWSYYYRLPILSLPFVIVSSLGYLAAGRYSNLLTNGLYAQTESQTALYLPIWIAGLLKSLGAILFMPNIWAGCLFLLLILLASRILFILVLLGYYTGTLLTAAMTGNFPDAFANINHFNYIWIAIAIGGIFLVPSLKSYVLAILAVASSTIVLHAVEVYWASYGISAFALPFNMVSMAFIYVLGVTAFPLLATTIKGTPEDTLDHYISNTRRFQGTYRTLSLPFAGPWQVWQGFNGAWTHQGSWQYAYDFVIIDEEGQTYQGEGIELEDYYAFRKPILAPCRGRITKVVNNLPNNPIGMVDRTDNWGNLIIIYDTRGFWVEISHFHQDSIRVKEGDWVEQGTLLGLCGNSGFSPQPHIHIQVQVNEKIGSATLPFSFVSFQSDNQYYANAQPAEKTIVEPLARDRSLQNCVSFTLDQTLQYTCTKDGHPVGTREFTVKMAPDGSFYLDTGKAQLYFGHHEGTFYVYSMQGQDTYLNLLFLALPRFPLAYQQELSWEDYVPVGALCHGLRKAIVLWLASFYHDLNQVHCHCQFNGPKTIEGVLTTTLFPKPYKTRVELDEHSGFKHIQFNGYSMTQIPKETVS